MSRSDLAAPLVALLLGFVLGVGANEALAMFVEGAAATSEFTSDTLAAPTAPSAAAAGCELLLPRVQVSWTATSSAWADGYDVSRSGTSGGPYAVVGTVSGQSTTSFLDSGLTVQTTYYYVVRATKAGWRSAPTGEASITTGLC